MVRDCCLKDKNEIHKAEAIQNDINPEEFSSSFEEKKIDQCRNKIRRQKMFLDLKKKKGKLKRIRKEQRTEAKIPRTIENTREFNQNVVNDDESLYAVENDEQSEAISKIRSSELTESVGRLLITCAHKKPSKKVFRFCKELERVFTNSKFIKRRKFTLRAIIEKMPTAGFTDLLVVSERLKSPDTLCLAKLPDGPTLRMRIVKHTTSRNMKIDKEELSTGHAPELCLTNFLTSLGVLVSRCLTTTFGSNPAQYDGRRIIVFHNQRDFIFFRHYRYVFGAEYENASEEEKERNKWIPYCPGDDMKHIVIRENQPAKKIVALKELGPRISLKLLSVQKGTCDFVNGEYLWLFNRHEMEKSRRSFQM